MYQDFERTAKEVEIAGKVLRSGMKIELGVGRRVIVGTMIAFDKVLYCFSIQTQEGEDIIIPYKSVKYIKVCNGGAHK